MGTFSIWHWIIVLVIVVLVFGTKKLRNLGSDLGGALKGFKEGMKESESGPAPSSHSNPTNEPVIEVTASKEAGTNTFKESVNAPSGPAPSSHSNPTNEPVIEVTASKEAGANTFKESGNAPSGSNRPLSDVEIKEKTHTRT